MSRLRSVAAIAVLVLMLVILPTGGRAAAAIGVDDEVSFTLDGYERRFIVHTPTEVPQPAPMLLALHGGGGSADQLERSSRLNELADASGFIVVYGEGTPLDRLPGFVWNAGRCCGPAVDAERAVDDVAYVREVVRLIGERHDIDSSRIYATGMSNGAMMAHRLACEAADLISGIAAISGTIQVDRCDPARPIPVLMMHGSEDDQVPYAGGAGSGLGQVIADPAEEVFAAWSERNGCGDDVVSEPVATPDASGDSVVRFVATGCDAPVVLYRVNGGGHEWFGGTPRRSQAGDVTTIISAPVVLAEFFDLI
ncbi:MAG: hydrolase [Thermomicrobiales bacterium]|nr:hydrolase [Thermomicrobiales bacterium]